MKEQAGETQTRFIPGDRVQLYGEPSGHTGTVLFIAEESGRLTVRMDAYECSNEFHPSSVKLIGRSVWQFDELQKQYEELRQRHAKLVEAVGPFVAIAGQIPTEWRDGGILSLLDKKALGILEPTLVQWRALAAAVGEKDA